VTTTGKIGESMNDRNKGEGRQPESLKSVLDRMIKGDTDPFLNSRLMRQVPDVIIKLLHRGNTAAAEKLMDKISQGVLNKDDQIRQAALEVMANLGGHLDEEQQIDEMHCVSPTLIRWINMNTGWTPAHIRIFTHLQKLVLRLMDQKRFSDANDILEVFSLIASGKMETNQTIRELTQNLLTKISAGNVLEALLEYYTGGDEDQKKQAIYSLVLLGTPVMQFLLANLYESEDAYERGNIIQILSRIGHYSSDIFVQHIEEGGPWYYMRNLVLLLGKTGTREHLTILEPFLEHDDFRVRQEAVYSILRLGGKRGTEIILSILMTSDDQLRIKIVSKLTELKPPEAVKPLIQLLEFRQALDPGVKAELDEKICDALAAIGSAEAVPLLAEIARKKKFFQKGQYGENVKAAAERALQVLEESTEN